MQDFEGSPSAVLRHRRVALLVALVLIILYGAVDVARSVEPYGYVCRVLWAAALAAAAALQRDSKPRAADAAARIVSVVSGSCTTVIVMAHGGSQGVYFGLLLGTAFCVLVLIPDLPSCAFLAGLSTTLGGVLVLIVEHRPVGILLEWVALSVLFNGLAAWGTFAYARLQGRERAARHARAEALLELRASNEKFDAAFSSTTMGAALVAMDGKIVAANAALHSYLGYPTLIGRSYFELVVPEEVDQAAAARTELARGGHPPRLDRRFVRRDGQVMLASVHASPVHGHAGCVEHAIVMIDDITERRSLRDRLAKSERLAALGTLAAGVAHEINNPLAYMKANLYWTREAFAEGNFEREEVVRAIAETERGAERIARIVGDLSAYARGRAEPTATELRPIIDDALRLISSRLEAASEVVVDVAPDLPLVMAVSRHLSQALVNLLANAVDAIEFRCQGAPDAARRVSVKVVCEGEWVAISVEDSGEGVRAEAAPHLFEPFFTTKGPAGTGLGLAISRENLSRFGATIEAGRSPLGGALFRVRVPRAAAAEAPLAATSTHGALVSVAAPAGSDDGESRRGMDAADTGRSVRTDGSRTSDKYRIECRG